MELKRCIGLAMDSEFLANVGVRPWFYHDIHYHPWPSKACG